MPRTVRLRTLLSLLSFMALVAPLAAGCGRSPRPRSRSRDAIFAERRTLPALFITAKSGRHVVAPDDRTMFVDPETGEIAWRAWACHNPDCPGRQPGGPPFLCIEGDDGYVPKPDGSIGFDPRKSANPKQRPGMCPRCSAIRDPARETRAEAERYERWVQLYVLPETAARLAELDAELERRVDLERRHRFTPLPD